MPTGCRHSEVTRALSDREREVLEGSARKAPVCFHANRNAFAQACKEAELTEVSRLGVSDQRWFGEGDRGWFGQSDPVWFGQADRGPPLDG